MSWKDLLKQKTKPPLHNRLSEVSPQQKESLQRVTQEQEIRQYQQQIVQLQQEISNLQMEYNSLKQQFLLAQQGQSFQAQENLPSPEQQRLLSDYQRLMRPRREEYDREYIHRMQNLIRNEYLTPEQYREFQQEYPPQASPPKDSSSENPRPRTFHLVGEEDSSEDSEL